LRATVPANSRCEGCILHLVEQIRIFAHSPVAHDDAIGLAVALDAVSQDGLKISGRQPCLPRRELSTINGGARRGWCRHRRLRLALGPPILPIGRNAHQQAARWVRARRLSRRREAASRLRAGMRVRSRPAERRGGLCALLGKMVSWRPERCALHRRDVTLWRAGVDARV